MSTKKESSSIERQKGFSVAEIVVAAGIFLLMAATFIGAAVAANNGVISLGARGRAVSLAEEGLEAVRSLRDANFANLADGTYGIAKSGATWSLVANYDTVDNFFARQVTIASIDASRKSVTARVSWDKGRLSPGSVSLATYLTNWQAVVARDADWLTVRTAGVSYNSPSRRILGIQLTDASASLPLTIVSMTVSWTGGSNGAQLAVIRINGANVWSSNINSGVLADITDTALAPGATYPLDYLQFSKSVQGATVTITFNLSDGSSKTATVTI